LATRFSEANNSLPSLRQANAEGSESGAVTFSPFKGSLYSAPVQFEKLFFTAVSDKYYFCVIKQCSEIIYQHNSMALIILIVLVIFIAVTATFDQRLRRTTLWAGRVISEPEILAQMPRGMQDAITPPVLTFLTVAILSARILILIVGTFFLSWYTGLFALILSFILSKLFGLLIPSTLPFYLQFLLRDMHRRNADYTRDRDFQRATASQDMISELSLLVSSASNLSIQVPTTLQALSAKKDKLFD
jgi:hypothetical protein